MKLHVSEDSKQVHALANQLVGVLNDFNVGTVGTKFDALAYVSAWFVLQVSGGTSQAQFAEAMDQFEARMVLFREMLDARHLKMADASRAMLEGALDGGQPS